MGDVRKVNEVKGKSEWERVMVEKDRKRLVVCEKCYGKIERDGK